MIMIKKIIISLILILILAGAGFILGLVSLAVPDGYVGIVETKINGVEDKLLIGGVWNWNWRWEKVLPTAMTIHLFREESYQADMDASIKGDIFPSGSNYATALDGGADFSYELQLFVEFSISRDALPELVREGLTPETLEAWSQKMARKMTQKISATVLAQPDLLFQADYLTTVRSILTDSDEFSSILIEQIIPKKVKVPDYDLYKLAKENYFILQEAHLKLKLEKLEMEKERNAQALNKEMDIIRKIDQYGEILANYPVIMDFLYLRNEKEKDFLKLDKIKEITKE